MSNHIEVPVYLQIRPEFWSYGGEQKVRDASLARATSRKPGKPLGGTLLVRLTLRFPAEAFLPLEPRAVIEIPADRTRAQEIEVIAEDPRFPDGD